jgi:DNA-binding transcriptional LysR family regulator
MHMNLHHLAIFKVIAETGSITAAAQRMHISQPALSRELKSLEDRLGLILFERLPRGMLLTHAGEVLCDYATRLFDISNTAELVMREMADARQGLLSIGASNTIGTYLLPPLLAAFRKSNPDINISMFVGNTGQVAQGVVDMRFTLGFIEGPLHLEGLITEQFQRDELIPVVALDHELLLKKTLSPSDLSKQPLLMREKGSGAREMITAALTQHDIELGNIMELGNTEALKLAAIHGGGIAWLPRISVTQELHQGSLTLLPVKTLMIDRPLSIIRRINAHLGPTCEAFLGGFFMHLKDDIP